MRMINQKEIEQPRTPAELRQFVAKIKVQVEADPDELKIARRKVGLHKMFVDEIIPLSLAADHICESHDLLQPIVSNQGYDVIVLTQDGSIKGKVEIVKPYDGKANAEDVKLLEKRGYGEIKIRDIGAGLTEIAARIIKTAEKKSIKDYSDCTLLIVGVITPPFDCELEPLAKAAELLCEDLKKLKYIAKQVIFVVPPLPQCYFAIVFVGFSQGRAAKAPLKFCGGNLGDPDRRHRGLFQTGSNRLCLSRG